MTRGARGCQEDPKRPVTIDTRWFVFLRRGEKGEGADLTPSRGGHRVNRHRCGLDEAPMLLNGNGLREAVAISRMQAKENGHGHIPQVKRPTMEAIR